MKALAGLLVLWIASSALVGIAEAQVTPPVDVGTVHYPPIARAASVEGDVTLSFVVGTDGHAADVQVVSGPQMLRGVALEDVSHWVFAGKQESEPRTVVFRFRLVPSADGYDGDDETRVELASGSEVRVFSVRTTGLNHSDCPHGAETVPPNSRSEGDFVELFRSGCYGSCPAYTVRVEASGRVIWNASSSVKVGGRVVSAIDPAKARDLLEKFRGPSFWMACHGYSKGTTDMGSYGLTVRLGERTNQVGEYADAAPEGIHELEMAVDEAADTHRWRVGDPRTESMAEIGNDAWMPKPGRTGLMQAVYEGKEDRIRKSLMDGAKLTDVDSSGWTPMMYAAGSYDGAATTMLLAAGADPNTTGPRGETALMFASLARVWDKDLVKAGAKVNAQTKDGVTPLMLLAQGGDADEIEAALRDGANARLKDAAGRTAMDYLVAANCGRRIVHEAAGDWMTTGYFRCNALQDEYSKARILLLRAGSRATRRWQPKGSPGGGSK